MSLLVIDNYDSFTYNLVQLVRELTGNEPVVWRNDKFTLPQVEPFKKIILSPGPGIPSEAGLMPELVRRYAPQKSILGVCLGHQCIGEIYGAALINLKNVVHGKGVLSRVIDSEEPLFRGLPEAFVTGRYHSWIVARENLPACLKVTAEDEQGHIMALRHVSYDVRGVQFHPESVLTEHGAELLRNWLNA